MEKQRKTSVQDDRQIIRIARKDRFITSRNILNQLDVKISPLTIRRRLNEAGLHSRKSANKAIHK